MESTRGAHTRSTNFSNTQLFTIYIQACARSSGPFLFIRELTVVPRRFTSARSASLSLACEYSRSNTQVCCWIILYWTSLMQIKITGWPRWKLNRHWFGLSASGLEWSELSLKHTHTWLRTHAGEYNVCIERSCLNNVAGAYRSQRSVYPLAYMFSPKPGTTCVFPDLAEPWLGLCVEGDFQGPRGAFERQFFKWKGDFFATVDCF